MIKQLMETLLVSKLEFFIVGRKGSKKMSYQTCSKSAKMTGYNVMNFILRDEAPRVLDCVK